MARSLPVEDLGDPLPYDPDFKGPLKHRSCTDVICLFIFIIFIACWIGVALYAFTNGNPDNLLSPKDSSGSRCGLDEHVKNKPHLFFFDLVKCVNPSVPFTGCPTKQVCVKSCPSEYFLWDKQKDVNKLICDYGITPTAQNAESLISQGKCARWYLPSTPFEDRCLPSLSKDILEELRQSLNISEKSITSGVKNVKILSDAEQVTERIIEDLITSWWKIVIGIVLVAVACIIYILIMRWIATFMVWFSLTAVVVLLGLAVYVTSAKYVQLKDNPVDDDDDDDDDKNFFESYLTKKDTWLVLAIISSIVLAIVLLLLLFLRKRIVLAIALVKEASKAVGYVMSVLIFPVLSWALQIGVIAFAIFVGLYLSTSGDPRYKIRNMNTPCCTGEASSYKSGSICVPSIFEANCKACDPSTICKFVGMNNPSYYPYLQVFNVFGFFWGMFFVSAFSEMTLAIVFATWYWTFKKSNLPFFAVTNAVLTTLRYHIGTLAFGSLIITICRIIRVLLEYIDRKLNKYDNALIKVILCCCKCCFWCLERFLRFINKNAFIMCGIHGKNFCASAKDAFSLLMRNIVRVFVLDKVTDFVFFLGKLMITVGCGAVAYLVFATDLLGIDNSDLHYDFVPVIFIMICTYLVASVFFSVYNMAVDTLFLCFLEDCERNDGSPEKPYYMSKNLMKILGKKNKMQ